jgi:hypothetical protein
MIVRAISSPKFRILKHDEWEEKMPLLGPEVRSKLGGFVMKFRTNPNNSSFFVRGSERIGKSGPFLCIIQSESGKLVRKPD